jgi:hypothetical protein
MKTIVRICDDQFAKQFFMADTLGRDMRCPS